MLIEGTTLPIKAPCKNVRREKENKTQDSLYLQVRLLDKHIVQLQCKVQTHLKINMNVCVVWCGVVWCGVVWCVCVCVCMCVCLFVYAGWILMAAMQLMWACSCFPRILSEYSFTAELAVGLW